MRPLKLTAALALGTCLAAPLAAQTTPQTTETAPMELSFERVFASPDLDGPSPRKVKLSPDGRYLTLLRNREEDRQRYDLWAYDRESAAWTMLVDSEALGTGRELSEDEKMQRERARVGNLAGIIDYQWTEDGTGVLVPLDYKLSAAEQASLEIDLGDHGSLSLTVTREEFEAMIAPRIQETIDCCARAGEAAAAAAAMAAYVLLRTKRGNWT